MMHMNEYDIQTTRRNDMMRQARQADAELQRLDYQEDVNRISRFLARVRPTRQANSPKPAYQLEASRTGGA